MRKLYKKQWIPCTAEEAWDFFSRPENLGKITPSYMNFQIQNGPLAEEIFPGMIIEYKVSPILNIPLRWVTEITQVDRLKSFVDDQKVGPYSLWHHRHTFTPQDGGILTEDFVHFKLPGGFLGEIAYHLQVKKQLESIFEHREQYVNELFKDRKKTDYVAH